MNLYVKKLIIGHSFIAYVFSYLIMTCIGFFPPEILTCFMTFTVHPQVFSRKKRSLGGAPEAISLCFK